MKNVFLLVIFIVGFVKIGISQKSINDYSYIVVSEQFEFQKDKDKYQLNSLTKFLFNKYGFHAYFEEEVPKNLDRCDGLIADAEGTPGFIFTVVQVVIKDCYGAEVFRSNKGNSKLKDYKKAYYESMREAFISIEALDIKQRDISSSSISLSSNEDVSLKNSLPINEAQVRPLVKNQVVSNNNININAPNSKYASYRFSETSYLLKKTLNGFNFYQEVLGAEDDLMLLGKLVLSESKVEFIDKNGSKTAKFDTSKNLIIGDKDRQTIYKFEN